MEPLTDEWLEEYVRKNPDMADETCTDAAEWHALDVLTVDDFHAWTSGPVYGA